MDKYRVAIVASKLAATEIIKLIKQVHVEGADLLRATDCGDSVRAVYKTDGDLKHELHQAFDNLFRQKEGCKSVFIAVTQVFAPLKGEVPIRVGPPVETIDHAYEERELINLASARA